MKTAQTWRYSFLLCSLLLALFPTYTCADIVWRQTGSGEVVQWHMNDATIASSTLINTIPPPWEIQGVGDFNGDGKPDILWRQTQSGDVAVWYMNGTTIAGSAHINTIPPPWEIQGVGDFNNDGKPDILWRQTQSGDVAVWYMNGVTITQGAYVNTIPPPWEIQGVGDFNGDGKPDILWRQTQSGDVAVWYMNGVTITQGAYINTIPQPWKIEGYRPAAVSGTVKAPGGAVAFYPNPGLLQRLARLFTTSADAAIAGISNVADGTVVELVRIDDAGNALSTIATTTVTNGSYFFNLASLHVGYSSDVIVQVRNQATGAKMRAFVTSGTANIDPVSEALVRAALEKVVAVSGTLASFTPQELCTLSSNMDYLTTLKQASAGANLENTVTSVKGLLAADPALSSFLTAASAPGQTTQVPVDVGDFFPMSVGNVWEARVTITSTGQPATTYTDVMQITGTRLFNGVSTLVIQESDPSRGILAEDYRAKTSAGITYYGNNDPTDTITPLIVPYMEAQFPLQVGSSFEQINRPGLDYGQDLDGDGIHETFSVYSTTTLVGFEAVTVDAGTFNNCAKLQTTLTVTVTLSYYHYQVTVTDALTEWYAPGVGPVKRHSVTSGSGYYSTEDYVLVAYNADGNHSATPSVASVQPAQGTRVKAAPSTITVVFSQDMNSSSINTSTFTVRDSGNNPIAGTVSYQNKRLTFTPSLPFPDGTYTVTMSTGVRDFGGISLVSPYTWSFTIDTTVPYVVSTTPANGAIGVGVSPTITTTFSEDMDPATVGLWYYFSIRDENSQLIGGSVTYSNRTATYSTQGIILHRGKTYTATIGTGATDLAGNHLSSDYTWSFSIEPGVFLSSVSLPSVPGYDIESVAIADMNGDGRNDVVMASSNYSDATSALLIYSQNAAHSLDPPLQIVYSPGGYCDAQSVAVGDMNHDGKDDIVVGNAGCNLMVFLQNPAGGFDSGIAYPTGDSAIIKIADLNNDGRMDIVSTSSQNNTVSIWYQNAGGGLDPPVFHSLVHGGYGGSDLAVGDINNDGRTDIVVIRGDAGTDVAIGVLTQKMDGTFNEAIYYNLPLVSQKASLAIGDVNGDGLNDVLVGYWSSALPYPGTRIGVFAQNAQGGLDPAVSYETDANSQSIQIADVNGDGLNDIIARHRVSTLGVFLQQPGATFGAEDLYDARSDFFYPGSMAVSDINGDRVNDIALAGFNGALVIYHR
ncbi:MAG TPA: FG-GAP-like repeat-containing protein [Syntrophorhabdales bacterium]|nr:FG-GAP-like repeat-containing protein [Syntrophorhabdales bacterium]